MQKLPLRTTLFTVVLRAVVGTCGALVEPNVSDRKRSKCINIQSLLLCVK